MRDLGAPADGVRAQGLGATMPIAPGSAVRPLDRREPGALGRKKNGAGLSPVSPSSKSIGTSVPSHDAIGGSASAALSRQPFRIRGRYFTAVALRPEAERPDAAFFAALDAQLRQTPKFFAKAPLIVDLAKVPGLSPRETLNDLVEGLRRRDLLPFGVQNATAAQAAAAAEIGLISVTTGRDSPVKLDRGEGGATSAGAQAEAVAPANLIVDRPVRSGQTVISERGDLTVIGPVSSGAELIAAGSIHVYGPLRGRAMAGVYGDGAARIFCQKLDAELLAIAGLYRTSENLEHEVRNRTTQVTLRDERLCVEVLG